jgi:uncharacterized protein (TIGR02117 family)
VAALHLVSRDWHTDIGLPVATLDGRIARLVAETWPGARHVVFGFGERAFLLSRNRSLADMVMALFPGPGALLVTGLSTTPAEAFGPEAVVVLPLTREELDALLGFLEASFAWDAEGRPWRLASGPYPGALFFASDLTYSAAYTCNTWTADGLAQAGLPVSPEGVLFAGQVMARGREAAEALGAATAIDAAREARPVSAR